MDKKSNNGIDGQPGRKRGRPEGFAAAEAKRTGRSARSIRRSLYRAEVLGEDLKDIIGTFLDSGAELDALCRLSRGDRKIIISHVHDDDPVSAVKLLQIWPNYPEPYQPQTKPNYTVWFALRDTWNAATKEERADFLAAVQAVGLGRLPDE